MLIWKDEYSIGVDVIDEQHKHLFEIGNNIYALLDNNSNSDRYDKIVLNIEDLRQYTKYHFKYEEEYMKKINYPKFFSQKVEHDDFIKKIDEVNLIEIDEDQEKYIRDILAFVFQWICEHILLKDRLIKA